MNDFTASNGVVIRRHETVVGIRRSVEDTDPVRVPGYAQPERVQTYLDPRQWDAIAEAVQAAADERLGRWRWPENPDYVVQPFTGGSGWNALCESTCVSDTFLSRDAVINSPSYLAPAVLAYFDAHPEPKPLPTVEGVYAMRPRVHLYERLIMLRGGQWLHLYTSASEFAEGISAEQVARTAVDEGRLTLLTPEVS